MTDSQISPFLGFLDDDELALPPIPSAKHPKADGGHVYLVPQPDAVVGSRLAALAQLMVKQAKGHELVERDIKRLNLDDREEVEFGHEVLGAVYDQLVEDGASFQSIKRAVNYAFVAFAFNEEAAQQMAVGGQLTGKAVPVETNRQERRASKSGNPATKAKAKSAPKK